MRKKSYDALLFQLRVHRRVEAADARAQEGRRQRLCRVHGQLPQLARPALQTEHERFRHDVGQVGRSVGMVVRVVGVDRRGSQILHRLGRVFAVGDKVRAAGRPSELRDREPR